MIRIVAEGSPEAWEAVERVAREHGPVALGPAARDKPISRAAKYRDPERVIGTHATEHAIQEYFAAIDRGVRLPNPTITTRAQKRQS